MVSKLGKSKLTWQVKIVILYFQGKFVKYRAVKCHDNEAKWKTNIFIIVFDNVDTVYIWMLHFNFDYVAAIVSETVNTWHKMFILVNNMWILLFRYVCVYFAAHQNYNKYNSYITVPVSVRTDDVFTPHWFVLSKLLLQSFCLRTFYYSTYIFNNTIITTQCTSSN